MVPNPKPKLMPNVPSGNADPCEKALLKLNVDNTNKIVKMDKIFFISLKFLLKIYLKKTSAKLNIYPFKTKKSCKFAK